MRLETSEDSGQCFNGGRSAKPRPRLKIEPGAPSVFFRFEMVHVAVGARWWKRSNVVGPPEKTWIDAHGRQREVERAESYLMRDDTKYLRRLLGRSRGYDRRGSTS